MKRVRGFVVVVALGATAFLAVALVGATFARAALFISTAGHLLTPAATLGAVAAMAFLGLRKPLLAALAAAIVAGGLVIVWPRNTVETCPTGTPTHRAVFYNVWAGNDHPDATVRFLASTNADVLVLAEVRDNIRPALEPLRATYPYRVETLGERTVGTVLYSRAPLENLIETLKQPGGRGSLVPATIAFPDGRVTIAGVHLTRPWPFGRLGSHDRQSARLADTFAALPSPKLLLGDLNAATWSNTVRTIEERSGSRALRSWGSWPSWLPLPLRLPIDQAIVGPSILCAAKTIGPVTGSDHRPIIVDFALAPRGLTRAPARGSHTLAPVAMKGQPNGRIFRIRTI